MLRLGTIAPYFFSGRDRFDQNIFGRAASPYRLNPGTIQTRAFNHFSDGGYGNVRESEIPVSVVGIPFSVPSVPEKDDGPGTNRSPGPPDHQKHAANKGYGEPTPMKHDRSKIFPGRNRTSLRKLSSVSVSEFLRGEFDDETFMCS